MLRIEAGRHPSATGHWDWSLGSDRGAGFWKKHRPRNSQRVLGCLALLSGTLSPSVFFPSVLSRGHKQLKAAWLSAAVSSSGGSLESCPPKQSQDFVHCTGIKPSTSASTLWGQSFAFCRDSQPGSALPSGVGVQGKLIAQPP